MLDSPYVRRVAISLKLLGISFEHQALSVFRNMDEFWLINPLIKAPSLVCDDGTVLMDSSLILDYVERYGTSGQSLMPTERTPYRQALRLIGIALVACEKTVQIVYERTLRPPEKQHQPWVERVQQQLQEAYTLLDTAVEQGHPWLMGDRPLQPDVTIAVAWTFTQFVIPDVVDPASYPGLSKFSAQAEALSEFVSTPLD
jgi:glutathione S-transferase